MVAFVVGIEDPAGCTNTTRCEMGQDTQEMLAVKFPNSYHLFPEFEKVCGTVKRDLEENNSEARICFNATGLDANGLIIVKCFETVLKIFRRNK